MYKIIKELCSSCGLCADVCPEGAISSIGVYIINQDLCSACGICQEDCPSNAIQIIKTA